MVCGVWCVVCGVWCVVCGVWCVVVSEKPNVKWEDIAGLEQVSSLPSLLSARHTHTHTEGERVCV